MMPEQISKLLERGQLPARRIAGQWRFSRAEINLWLEERIGISSDEELAAMETNLERVDTSGTGEVSIEKLLTTDAIAVPLLGSSRTKIVTAMCELAASTGKLWDPEKMAQAVLQREAMHPTVLDIGVALLHPRRPQSNILAEAVIALGITRSGIPFGGRSGLADVFFLICATSDHEHLRILARLSRMIHEPDWMIQLRAAKSVAAVHSLIALRDAELISQED